MAPKSVSYHVGDGKWQELKWDEQLRLFVSDDGTVRVAKPRTEDGKETTVRAQWGASEYAVTCTPGYDPTICSIYDPSKGQGGRVEIRFGSTPPAVVAQPVAAAPAAAPPPAPPAAAPSSQPTPAAAASGGAQLSKKELGEKVASWISRDYPPNQRSKALADMRKNFKNFSGQYTQAEAEAKYAAARNPATAEPQARPVRDDRAPAARPSAATPPSTTPAGLLTGKALGEHVATWVHEHYKDDVKGPMFHLTELRGRLSHGDKKGFYSVRTNPRALDAFLNAYLTAHPSTPKSRPNLGKHEDIDLGAPRGNAKGAATEPPADSRKAEAARKVAEARAEKVRVAAEAKAVALEKRKAALAQKAEVRAEAKRKADEAKQAAANQKIQDAAAKAAERDNKLFEVAKTVLERVTEIGKMPSAEVAKITADELSTLYRGIKDYNKGDKVYDAARAQLISLSKQKAQSIVDGLKQKQATVEMIAKEGPDSARKLWRAMAEFRSLYQTAKHDLKTLEALEPQTAHHKEITAINAAINRVRVADIRGEERKMRSELAKVTSALERIRNQMPKSGADSEQMAVLYKVAEEMATATENLDAFRKQHKDQLPKEVALIEGQRSNLAQRLQGLQAPLIVEIRKYPGKMPQVENFDDPSQYGWITDETPSPDGKVRDLQVKYAKALIDAAQKLLGPDPKKWDDAVIVDPDSRNVEIWKKYWKTAHTAIHLVDEFKKTGKTPALVPAAAPIDARTPAEKVRDAAADAAKAAIAAKEKIAHDRFEPIRKDLQSQISWVNGVNMKLLDDYGRPKLPTPPVKKLEEFEARLKEIQTTLGKVEIDESGMSEGDIHAVHDLESDITAALGLIAKLLTYIDKAKTAPPEPARAVVGADVKPVPAPAISESDAQKTPDQFQEELGSKGLLIAGAETDPRKISEVEEHKKRVTQILEAARQRAKEPGMQEVIRAAENVLKRANSKIRELGGTVPAAPTSRPTSTPPATIAPRADARAQRAEQAAVQRAHVQYVKVRDALKTAIVDTTQLHGIFHDDKGNTKNIPLNTVQIRDYREKVNALDRQLGTDLDDALRNTLSVADKKEWDDLQPKRGSAQNSLTDISEALVRIEGENAAKEKASVQQPSAPPPAVEADAKTRVEESSRRAFNARMDEVTKKRAELTSIDDKLSKKPSLEQLAKFEITINEAKSTIEGLYSDPKDTEPNAQGFLNTCEVVLKRIVVLRTELEADKKYDAIRADVTAEMKKTDELKKLEGPKKVKLDISTLQANIEKIAAIKNKLEGINKDVPETEKTRSLKNLISSNIARIETYIAEIETAISQKKAEEEALRKAEDRPAKKTPQAEAAPPSSANAASYSSLSKAILLHQKTIDTYNADATLEKKEIDANTKLTTLKQIRIDIQKGLAAAVELKNDPAFNDKTAALEKTLHELDHDAVVQIIWALKQQADEIKANNTLKPRDRIKQLETINQQLEDLKSTVNALAAYSRGSSADDLEAIERKKSDIKGIIDDIKFSSANETPAGLAASLSNRIPALLSGRVTALPDGSGIMISGVDMTNYEVGQETLFNKLATYPDKIAAAIIQTPEKDTLKIAHDLSTKLIGRQIPSQSLNDPRVTGSGVSLILFFDKKSADAYYAKIKTEVAGIFVDRKNKADAAEAKRLAPLTELRAIAKTHGGLAIESDKDKPVLGKHEIYAAKIRVANGVEALAFIRGLAQKMNLDEANDFLVIAHKEIADQLTNGPSVMKIQTVRGSKPGSRIFAASSSKPGDVYVVMPSPNRPFSGIARSFDDHYDALFPYLQKLGLPKNTNLSEPVDKGAQERVKQMQERQEAADKNPLGARVTVPTTPPAAPTPATTDSQGAGATWPPQITGPKRLEKSPIPSTDVPVYRAHLKDDDKAYHHKVGAILKQVQEAGATQVIIRYHGSVKRLGGGYSDSSLTFARIRSEALKKGKEIGITIDIEYIQDSPLRNIEKQLDAIDYIALKDTTRTNAVKKQYADYIQREVGRTTGH